MDEILATMRRDNVKAWSLRSDGSYARVVPRENEETVRSQQRFMELARERARETEGGILGLSSSKSLPGPVRALDKLRRRGKKKKRRNREA
jgi:polyphosphate kinase